jgi:hypothetical protein
MNCELLQRRLLNLERPDRPPAEVQAHLAGCPSCREWQRRLVRLEQRVALLPVPPSTAKAEFVARLRAGQGERAARQPNGTANRGQRRERALRKLALATSLAAALMLLAVMWWALQWSQTDQKLPGDLLAQLVQHDVELAKVDTQPSRLKELTATADDLHAQAGLLCRMKYADDLGELARWYRQVVEKLPQQAQGLTNGDPEKLARHLDEADHATRKLVASAPPDCVPPLRDMAAAARDAAGQLRSPQARGSQLPRTRAALPGAQSPVLCAGAPVLTASLVPAAVPGTVLASAGPGASPDAAKELAQRFQKNRNLLAELVKEAVRLADLPGDQNALKRASHCSKIAEQLADAMKQAAGAEHQGARVKELANHLELVLQGGVAHNLSEAHAQIPKGVFSENDLHGVWDQTAKVLGKAEEQLQTGPDAQDDNTKAALNALEQGREQVRKALQATP